MAIVNLIAKIAERMPYTVLKTRYFKHFHHWPRLKGDIARFDNFVQYVMRNGLDNRDNVRWATLADKFAVRNEVERVIGAEHLVPLLGAWENPEDIDFDALPDSFILKTNNGCGTNIFVHDKAKANRNEIIAKLKKDLAFPYPQLTGQLHYALIKPMVIAERIMVQDGGHKSLTDYKIHCVNGRPYTLYVFTDRDETNHFDFNMKAYTASWREMPPGTSPADVENNPEAPNRPDWLDDMLEMASKLSQGEEYVRVDFYRTEGKILFGEMTLTPDTGFHPCYAPYRKAMKYLLDKIIEQRQNNTSSH